MVVGKCAMAALVLLISFAILSSRDASAQPCKSIQGNCGIQLPKPDDPWAITNLTPMRSIAGDIAVGPDQPGMIGAITFHGGGSACMGILRRGGCK